MNRIVASFLITLMFVLSLAVPVLAQSGCELVGTLSNGATILYCPPPDQPPTATPEPPTPTPTATALPATPEPTATSVPPTATATPTNTATPAATATPGPVAAWQCPESAHDKTRWHPHYNSQLGCWYDHVHGADPAAINYVFGAPWAFLKNYPQYDATKPEWNLGTISYPWLTGNGMEQSMKHGGYKWQVAAVNPEGPGVVKVVDPNGTDWNWITAGPTWNEVHEFRYEEHFGGMVKSDGMTMFDSHTRIHSFWVEMRGENGAVIRGGGHWDTGRFWRYSQFIIPMPDIDPNPVSPFQTGENGHFSDPYRGDDGLCRERPYGSPITALWTSKPPWADPERLNRWDYQHNNHLGVFSAHQDFSVCTNPDGTHELICKEGDVCPWANNTKFAPFRVWAYVSPSWDGSKLDRDVRPGWVTVYTWTNVKGLPNAACTAPGPDCVPFVIENAQPGWYTWYYVGGQNKADGADFDQSPPGKSYINLYGN